MSDTGKARSRRHPPAPDLWDQLRKVLRGPALAGVYEVLFRLSLPASGPPLVAYQLQSRSDPSLRVEPERIWTWPVTMIAAGSSMMGPRDRGLTSALRRAAQIFPPIRRSLRSRRPRGVVLDEWEAWELIEKAPRLGDAGFWVLVPSEVAQERVRPRLKYSPEEDLSERPEHLRFTPGALSDFRLEAAIGNEVLGEDDLLALAEAKRPLVRLRGRWVAVDPEEVRRVLERLRSPRSGPAEALGALLSGRIDIDESLEVEVLTSEAAGELIERLAGAAPRTGRTPEGFRGILRPYQLRGLAWLEHLEEAGFGGCLADDMGLGKTVQVIALLCSDRKRTSGAGPTLVVCPPSVVGNWERELRRFAPDLTILRHHGSQRIEGDTGDRDAVVVTTYGTLRRDASLRSIGWRRVVLDEAQNIKNPATKTAQAARAIPAPSRIALTGTPIENRLGDLWSIMEFSNPGLLGSRKAFRRRFALPVENGDTEATERLHRIIRPFVMRRVKSDPAVAPDLPDRVVNTAVCPLTREQATLYRAVLDEGLAEIAVADGITRRGKILAMITALKQVCDHPALYLKEKGPLAGRSGKLLRLTEMLEEVIVEGDAALIFTQFASMGRLLVAHLTSPGLEPLFLHGGTPRAERDRLVDVFQEDSGPPVFILSLRAGGTGLNLTRATRVFHFDRWWNPAVEDQATDRVHRIGQHHPVMVHSLVASGTLEERIAKVLEHKRGLFQRVVGAGEAWLTELPLDELAEMTRLSPDDIDEI